SRTRARTCAPPPGRRERLPPAHRDPERLLCRIYVVEVEVEDGPAVAADRAAATGFLDQGALDLLVAPRDRIRDAPLAADRARWAASDSNRDLRRLKGVRFDH